MKAVPAPRRQRTLPIATALIAAAAFFGCSPPSESIDDEIVETVQPLVTGAARRTRVIPIRFVQFATTSPGPVSQSELQEKIDLTNTIFADAGLVFYLAASHTVLNSTFADLDANPTYTWPSDLATSDAIASWNPNCVFPRPVSETSRDALRRAGTYCAFGNEVLVYVSNSWSMGGEFPWNTRVIGMTRLHLDNNEPDGNFGVFPHEIGHYLGLPHTFPGSPDGHFGREYNLTNGSRTEARANWNVFNPETGQRSLLSTFWDLVYKPKELSPTTTSPVFFNSAAAAAAYETSLQPIEDPQGEGHICKGTTDPHCRKADGSYHPNATLRMPVGVPGRSVQTYSTGDAALKGLAFSTSGGRGINIMSYGYATAGQEGGYASPRNGRVSKSQLEQIDRSLRFDIAINLFPLKGVMGRRPLLGRIWNKDLDGFGLKPGIDRWGYDYRNFEVPSESVIACRNACLQDQRCRAYTFVARRGSEPARCWLKDNYGDQRICADCVSGDNEIYDVGFDRPGGDYRSFILPANRPELCSQSCAKDNACAAYTYMPSNGQCWLKGQVTPRAAHSALTSGVKTKLVNLNFWGVDYRSFATNAGPEACSAPCSVEAGCAGFTWVPPGVQGPVAVCWLKSALGEPREMAGAVSGIKRGLAYDTDMTGSAFLVIRSGNERDCQVSCETNAQCQSFTFSSGTSGTTPVCSLKSSVGTAKLAPRVISGIKGVAFF